ncbi:MAG TPA: hypothetical protein VMV90_11660 [Rectinemataceae bacterium]|nr:hypothetical protein [Rectinemataceae bacterium]
MRRSGLFEDGETVDRRSDVRGQGADGGGGTLVEPEIAASYAITPKVRLGLRVSYRSIQGLRGDEKLTLTQDYTVTNSDGSTSTYPAGYTETYANSAGAALEYLEVDLSLSFQF